MKMQVLSQEKNLFSRQIIRYSPEEFSFSLPRGISFYRK